MEYIIDPILPKNQIHILGGSSGAGKTTLLFQLCDCIRRGKDVLGMPTKQTNFLYCTSDRTIETYLELFKRLGIEPFKYIYSIIDAKAERMKSDKITAVEDLYFWLDWLTKYLETLEEKIDLIWLDTALFALPIQNFNDQRQVMEGMTHMAAWAKAYEISVGMTTHTNKTKKNEDFINILNRVSGSHGLLGYASTKALLIGANETKDGVPILHLQGQHYADMTVTFRRNSNGSFAPISDYERMLESYFVLDSFTGLEEVPVSQVVQRARNDYGASRSTCYRQLKELEAKGILQQCSRGHWRRIRVA